MASYPGDDAGGGSGNMDAYREYFDLLASAGTLRAAALWRVVQGLPTTTFLSSDTVRARFSSLSGGQDHVRWEGFKSVVVGIREAYDVPDAEFHGTFRLVLLETEVLAPMQTKGARSIARGVLREFLERFITHGSDKPPLTTSEIDRIFVQSGAARNKHLSHDAVLALCLRTVSAVRADIGLVDLVMGQRELLRGPTASPEGHAAGVAGPSLKPKASGVKFGGSFLSKLVPSKLKKSGSAGMLSASGSRSGSPFDDRAPATSRRRSLDNDTFATTVASTSSQGDLGSEVMAASAVAAFAHVVTGADETLPVEGGAFLRVPGGDARAGGILDVPQATSPRASKDVMKKLSGSALKGGGGGGKKNAPPGSVWWDGTSPHTSPRRSASPHTPQSPLRTAASKLKEWCRRGSARAMSPKLTAGNNPVPAGAGGSSTGGLSPSFMLASPLSSEHGSPLLGAPGISSGFLNHPGGRSMGTAAPSCPTCAHWKEKYDLLQRKHARKMEEVQLRVDGAAHAEVQEELRTYVARLEAEVARLQEVAAGSAEAQHERDALEQSIRAKDDLLMEFDQKRVDAEESLLRSKEEYAETQKLRRSEREADALRRTENARLRKQVEAQAIAIAELTTQTAQLEAQNNLLSYELRNAQQPALHPSNSQLLTTRSDDAGSPNSAGGFSEASDTGDSDDVVLLCPPAWTQKAITTRADAHAATVFDQPYPITYDFTPSIRPKQVSFEFVLCSGTGVAAVKGVTEYITMRSARGTRSVCLQITPHELNIPCTTHSVALSKFTRYAVLLIPSWRQRTYTICLNGVAVAADVPFRDDGCDDLGIFDVHPRETVLVSYADIRFLTQ